MFTIFLWSLVQLLRKYSSNHNSNDSYDMRAVGVLTIYPYSTIVGALL